MTFKTLASYQHDPFEKGQTMSIFQNLVDEFHASEARVLDIITAIKKGEQVVAHDIHTAESWIASNAPTIIAQSQKVLAFVAEVAAVAPGVGSNPDVAAAVKAVQLADTALSAFATSYNAGQGSAQSVLNGYIAVNQMNAAVASVKAAVTAAPTPGPAV